MLPFDHESAAKRDITMRFGLAARRPIIELANTIFEQDLALWILLDIVTTTLALKLGAHELNPGAAYIMSVHPALWVAGLLSILVVAIVTGRILNRYYKNNIGICLIILPVLIEAQAVINNIGVIRYLI